MVPRFRLGVLDVDPLSLIPADAVERFRSGNATASEFNIPRMLAAARPDATLPPELFENPMYQLERMYAHL